MSKTERMLNGILARVNLHQSTNSSANDSRFVQQYSTLQLKFTQHYISYLKVNLVQICQIKLQSQYFQCFLVDQCFSGSLFQWFEVQQAGMFLQYGFTLAFCSSNLYFHIINPLFIVSILVCQQQLSWQLMHFLLLKKFNLFIQFIQFTLFNLFMALILFQFKHLVVHNLLHNQRNSIVHTLLYKYTLCDH